MLQNIKKYWMWFVSIGFFSFFLALFIRICLLNRISLFFVYRRAVSSIVLALLGLLIFNFLRKKLKKGKLEFFIFCFSISFFLYFIHLATITKKSPYVSKKTTQDMQAFSTITGQIENMIKEIPQSNNQYGILSAVSVFLKELSDLEQESLKITNVVIEIQEISRSEKLCNPVYITQSRDRLNYLSEKINQYENKRKKIMNNFEAQIVAKNPNFSSKEIQRLKNENKIQWENGIKKYNNILKELILNCDDLLSSLSSINGFYRVSGGQVLFSRERDLETFNPKMIKINDLFQKENLQYNKMSKDRTDALQGMKNHI